MLISFFSNYFNHHQKALCDELTALEDTEFYFIETQPMEQFRRDMGWQQAGLPSYVIAAHSSGELENMALELADRSDLVIIGSAPEYYIKKRLEENKLTFRYTERPMKEGRIKMFIPRLAKKFYELHYKNRDKNIYLLGASAYAAYDYSLLHSYPGRCLKFGYFPEGEEKSFEEILSRKNNRPLRILWTGRFLKLKKAELLLKALGSLKRRGFSFSLLLVGNGEREEALHSLCKSEGLEGDMEFRDFVKPQEVRGLMEEADIYVCTSNHLEGWGSVIYEALSAGCAVVASHACGCSPWLIKQGETGLLFKSGSVSSLERALEKFLTDEGLRSKCQRGAYEQMQRTWNPRVAAKRIREFAGSFYEAGGSESFGPQYEDGPLSRAEILKNNWFKDE